MSTVNQPFARIDFRTSPEIKKLIVRAALTTGASNGVEVFKRQGHERLQMVKSFIVVIRASNRDAAMAL